MPKGATQDAKQRIVVWCPAGEKENGFLSKRRPAPKAPLGPGGQLKRDKGPFSPLWALLNICPKGPRCFFLFPLYIRRLWSVPFGDGEPFGHILRPPKGRKPKGPFVVPEGELLRSPLGTMHDSPLGTRDAPLGIYMRCFQPFGHILRPFGLETARALWAYIAAFAVQKSTEVLTLSLFVFLICTNNHNLTFTFNYTTVFTHFFYRSTHFHTLLFLSFPGGALLKSFCRVLLTSLSPAGARRAT